MKTVKISEFKAKCIEALKQVQATGEPLVVTLRNDPIATIHPYEASSPVRTLGKLRGHITVHGDIVHTDGDGEWEMER